MSKESIICEFYSFLIVIWAFLTDLLDIFIYYFFIVIYCWIIIGVQLLLVSAMFKILIILSRKSEVKRYNYEMKVKTS